MWVFPERNAITPDVGTEKKREKSALKKLVDELGLDEIKVPSPPDTHEKSRRWHCKCKQLSSSTDTSSCDTNEFTAEKPP